MPDMGLASDTGDVTEKVDVLIAGSGFAGLCAAIKLQQSGNTSFLILEKAATFGGTWRDNVYPGCACDIASHLYSLSFAPNTNWSRMYPTQPEIFAYIQNIAAKHKLAEKTRFGAELRAATWDEARACWRVRTADGRLFEARVLFAAMGPLHIPVFPNVVGRADFAGPSFHSAQWDFSVDLAGKNVAVIGTGASALQFIPQIAGKAARLTVYQRTPPWVMPKLDYAFSAAQQRRFTWPLYRRLFRARIFLINELRALGFLGNLKVTQAGEAMARAHLKQQITDPELRAKLTPNYQMGCKRVLISNDYYPALAQYSTELVTGEIAEIRPHSIVTQDGKERAADVIIYGTGFRTTDSFSALHITGRNGLDLNKSFAQGMHAYRGVTVPEFPNLFFLLGPNTGLGHNSVVLMIEAQVRYVMSLFRQMTRRGARVAEVRADVEKAWNDKLQTKIRSTVWNTGGCKSWYLDADGRNSTIWPGFVAEYQLKMLRANIADYKIS